MLFFFLLHGGILNQSGSLGHLNLSARITDSINKKEQNKAFKQFHDIRSISSNKI